jgi:two-component system probable response regulator PhcQ
MNVKHANEAARAGTILFVDDEPLSLKYFKASVGKYANVVTADSPEAALKILETKGDDISVVVSDERMPRDSGVAFLSDVRKSWPSTVRILTSAYANIDLEQAINGAAIHRFVPKPWDLDELCAAMKDALHGEALISEAAVPALGSEQSTDAHNASVELLAVLSRELSRPLKSLDSAATSISALTGMQPIPTSLHGISQNSNWPARYRDGKLAAAADQMHRDIAYCKALSEPITALSESLSDLVNMKTYSMAETTAETLENIGRRSNRKIIELDARHDFQYRMPKQVVAFVLSSLLQSATESLHDGRTGIRIEFVRGRDRNEVRIISAEVAKLGVVSPHSERISRSALWAFGGELLFSSDNRNGTQTASICLPRVLDEAPRASH